MKFANTLTLLILCKLVESKLIKQDGGIFTPSYRDPFQSANETMLQDTNEPTEDDIDTVQPEVPPTDPIAPEKGTKDGVVTLPSINEILVEVGQIFFNLSLLIDTGTAG